MSGVRLAKYGTQTNFVFPMIKRGVVDFALSADWTPAAGDVKISQAGGGVVNTTNLPAIISGTGGALWLLTLTAAELTTAGCFIQIVDSATKAVEDNSFEVYTYGNASAKFAVDYSDAVRFGLTALPNAAAEAAGGLYTRGTGAGQVNQTANGQLDANVAAMVADVLTSSALNTNAVAEIVAGLKGLIVETQESITLGQSISLMLSILGGITTNGGLTFKTRDGVATRAVAVTDGSNNRTAMTFTPSS